MTVNFNATDFSAKKASSTANTNDYGLVYLTYNVTEIQSFSANNAAEFIRFSVGPKSGVDSLVTYARLNDLPSQSYFDVNGTMEYVSQFILSNPQSAGQWYFAVVANNDFWAWCGRMYSLLFVNFSFSNFLFQSNFFDLIIV